MHGQPLSSHLFFFNATATTEIYTLALHDALPICERIGDLVLDDLRSLPGIGGADDHLHVGEVGEGIEGSSERRPQTPRPDRSEEHTSEPQSQSNLVCRLLLEKKKR